MTDLATIRFERDAFDRLTMIQADGQTHVGVEPVLCFPLSDPDKSVAILDSEGHELMTLPDLSCLNPMARDTLKADLVAREFVPEIQRIISTSNPNPPCRWTVETDRGQTSFQLESEDDIRKLGPNRVMIADSNGIRYTIRDVKSLDLPTQRIVQRLV